MSWTTTPAATQRQSDGEEADGRRKAEEEARMSLSLTTRMTCIKMGSDESHFNVSLIVRDKVIRLCPQTTTFVEKGEPKRY